MASAKDAKSAPKTKAAGIVTPAELNKIEQDRESAAAREALEKMRRVEQDQRALHEAFMTREIGPDFLEAVLEAPYQIGTLSTYGHDCSAGRHRIAAGT